MDERRGSRVAVARVSREREEEEDRETERQRDTERQSDSVEGRSKGEGGGMQRAACALLPHARCCGMRYTWTCRGLCAPVLAYTGCDPRTLRSIPYNVDIHRKVCRSMGLAHTHTQFQFVCLTVYVRRRPCSIGFGMPGLGSIPLFINKGQLTLEREERKTQDRARGSVCVVLRICGVRQRRALPLQTADGVWRPWSTRTTGAADAARFLQTLPREWPRPCQQTLRRASRTASMAMGSTTSLLRCLARRCLPPSQLTYSGKRSPCWPRKWGLSWRSPGCPWHQSLRLLLLLHPPRSSASPLMASRCT
jgi:hypothetical protein